MAPLPLNVCTALMACWPRPGTAVMAAGGCPEFLAGLAHVARCWAKVYTAFAVALPLPTGTRLARRASTWTVMTRKTGLASTVNVHSLFAWPCCGWIVVGVPLMIWRRTAVPTTLHALGTALNSPFCKVVMNGLFGAGDCAR